MVLVCHLEEWMCKKGEGVLVCFFYNRLQSGNVGNIPASSQIEVPSTPEQISLCTEDPNLYLATVEREFHAHPCFLF